MHPANDFESSEAFADAERGTPEETVVPVYVEEASILKRSVSSGGIAVSKTTHVDEKLIDELLQRERVEVERKPIGKRVDSLPAMREELDTIIIPVVEEEVVVERYLVLKEEIHIHRIRATERFQDRVQLRRQEATITRLSGDTPGSDDHPASGTTS